MLKDVLKRWNRRRLDKRRLKQSGRQERPIDAASLSSALGADIQHLQVPHLFIAVHLGHTTDADPAADSARRTWQALLAALEAVPSGIQTTLAVLGATPPGQHARSIITLPDAHHPMRALPTAMQTAQAHGATHLIWVDRHCIVEPGAFTHLLHTSEAAGHQALVDALHFPQEAPKTFDSDKLDTPWVSSQCLLMPSAGFSLLDHVDAMPQDRATLEAVLSRQAQAARLRLLSCPTALVRPPTGVAAMAPDRRETLSVVIRHHDSDKFAELQRCLFSIACSTYAAIEAVVVCQSFEAEELAAIQRHANILTQIHDIDVLVLNPHLPEQIDHRSRLLNIGIAAASGRYLAFLDYDDCIHPASYASLIQACQASRGHIAFGDIAIKKAAVVGQAVIVRGVRRPWGPRGLLDLLHDNCCPIHSYIIDRSGIPESTLQFDTALSRYEDYDFLIKVCSQYRSDFSLISEVVGDYYIKEDGSNSVITSSSFSSEAKQSWQASKQMVHDRRDRTLLGRPVLDQVNQAFATAGLPLLKQGATVHDLNLRAASLRQRQ